MKIRLEGTPQEIKEFIANLKTKGIEIQSQSKFYPNHNYGEDVEKFSGRVYIEITP